MHPSINMDNNKKKIVEASSSSTMNFDYLFGPKKSSSTLSSSSTLFDSIFPPSSFVGGRDWRKQNVGGKNYGASGTHNSKGESSGSRICNKSTSSNNQNEEVEPSYFSSSIYYGGQENYIPRSRTITEPHHHVFYKKGEVDDPNGKDPTTASRGNWWEGSLYY